RASRCARGAPPGRDMVEPPVGAPRAHRGRDDRRCVHGRRIPSQAGAHRREPVTDDSAVGDAKGALTGVGAQSPSADLPIVRLRGSPGVSTSPPFPRPRDPNPFTATRATPSAGGGQALGGSL